MKSKGETCPFCGTAVIDRRIRAVRVGLVMEVHIDCQECGRKSLRYQGNDADPLRLNRNDKTADATDDNEQPQESGERK